MIEDLIEIAKAAGRAILEIYAGEIEVQSKADRSPVTAADRAAEAIILEGLKKLSPDLPVIAEEEVAAGRVPKIGTRFWLVDPLDGTREFLSRNGEFTVNIALIEARRPVLGVVLAPAIDRVFYAPDPTHAFESGKPIHVRRPSDDGLVVVASRSHRDSATDALIAGMPVKDFRTAGSSLKFCLVASGEADLYPRTGRTMEWDTAAGHAILSAAGGKVLGLDGEDFLYGKPGFENPGFIASGG